MHARSKPTEDPWLLNLKRIASKGGEYGPMYDRGVLSVITQIEGGSTFTVSDIAGILLLMEDQQLAGAPLLDAEEFEKGKRFLSENSMTLEQGTQYATGIKFAEGVLQHLK